MSELLVLRHGPTDWNADGLIQGRADPPLSAAGRDRVRRWRLPAGFEAAAWRCSPLTRAAETARLLGGAETPDPRLIEMDWGEWQGRRLSELRAEPASRMAERESRGLDFQPPAGESYRMVQRRLTPFLADRRADGRPTVVVCHKGVIRALYALATGWAMTGPPPHKMLEDCCHLFQLDEDGRPEIVRVNIPLLP